MWKKWKKKKKFLNWELFEKNSTPIVNIKLKSVLRACNSII